jgi:hypothetical protein
LLFLFKKSFIQLIAVLLLPFSIAKLLELANDVHTQQLSVSSKIYSISLL